MAPKLSKMEFSAEMIAGLLGGEVIGDGDASIYTVSSIEGGKEGGLAYLSNPRFEPYLYTTKCSIVLVERDFEPKEKVSATLIKVDNVNACVLRLLDMYNAMKPQKKGVSKLASISLSRITPVLAVPVSIPYIARNCSSTYAGNSFFETNLT